MKYWDFISKDKSKTPKTRKQLFYHLNNAYPEYGIDICKYDVWFIKIGGKGGVNTGLKSLQSATYDQWERHLVNGISFLGKA